MQIEIILIGNSIDIGQGRTKSGSRINQQTPVPSKQKM